MLLCLQVDHEYPSAAAVPPCDKRGNSSDHRVCTRTRLKKTKREDFLYIDIGYRGKMINYLHNQQIYISLS